MKGREAPVVHKRRRGAGYGHLASPLMAWTWAVGFRPDHLAVLDRHRVHGPDAAGRFRNPGRLDRGSALLGEAAVAGLPRRHVPDIALIDRAGAITIVNVKPPNRIGDPKVAATFAWAGRVFEARGWHHEMWTGALEMLWATSSFWPATGAVTASTLNFSTPSWRWPMTATRSAISSAAAMGSGGRKWCDQRCCTCCGRAGCGSAPGSSCSTRAHWSVPHETWTATLAVTTGSATAARSTLGGP